MFIQSLMAVMWSGVFIEYLLYNGFEHGSDFRTETVFQACLGLNKLI